MQNYVINQGELNALWLRCTHSKYINYNNATKHDKNINAKSQFGVGLLYFFFINIFLHIYPIYRTLCAFAITTRFWSINRSSKFHEGSMIFQHI